LHVNELLRTTNTGHIACFLLDGPLRVWGLDDEWLDRLRPTEELPADDRGDPRVRLNVLLYPEEGCDMLTDFVPSALTARAASSSVEMHYMLSDGTWGQAHRVNRHVPRDIPRVALTIPEEYEPLFAALRRQTRSTGVSTLEAVMLAVEAQGAAAKAAHTHAAQAEQASSAVLTCFTATMKRFVDTVLVLKNANAVFADAHDDEFLADAAEKRNRNKTLRQVEERAARERELGPAAVQALMAPPVVSFCYVCDTYIGWSRMPEHVTGARHRELLLVNPAGMPSERSRDVTCDYRLLRVMPKGPS
jgi:DTW domain-containing protein YfiP